MPDIPDTTPRITIILTALEVWLGTIVGTTRGMFSVVSGGKDKYGAEKGDGWFFNINGACGEIAFAKYIHVFWIPTINAFGEPDVFGRFADYHVRTRSKDDYELYLRKKDKPGIYVLLTGRYPNFTIRGWFYWQGWDWAEETLPREWKQTHGDRPVAYFVPHDKMEPMDTLPDPAWDWAKPRPIWTPKPDWTPVWNRKSKPRHPLIPEK